MKSNLFILVPLVLLAIWFGNLGEVVEITESYGSSFMISSIPIIRS